MTTKQLLCHIWMVKVECYLKGLENSEAGDQVR